MVKKSKADKSLDAAIEREYYRQAQGVQVNIMDIGRIYADCRRDVALSMTLESAMRAALDKYGVLS